MIKAEDFKQTWEDVGGLNASDMRQWFKENMDELPYLVTYLLTLANIPFKIDTTNVRELPACDFCGKAARFEGKVERKHRPYGEVWQNMCEACFETYGEGLGSGIGYKLELVKL